MDIEGLKPGSIGCGVLEEKSVLHNDALVFFTEDRLKDELKEFIEFKDKYNYITKDTLTEQQKVDKDFASKFKSSTTFIENKGFENTLKELLKSDYGLLIQPSPRITKADKYALTHYRVEVSRKIDPVVESLVKKLGYIEKDLYEKGEEYQGKLEEKFFAYYGFHYTAGGRRRAGIIASQIFRDMEMSFATYIASKEARTLTKITENEEKIRYALVNLSKKEIKKKIRPALVDLSHKENKKLEEVEQGFREQFVYDENICVLQVIYDTTKYSRPIKSSRRRKLDSNKRWLKIIKERIIPKRKFVDTVPIPCNIVYPHKDYSIN
ncbi:MAG: hypothetical protein KJ968_01990 [Nanoarchaeota archaeon]|nr:hypothetical protein [Nanoarchaeota archaeon]